MMDFDNNEIKDLVEQASLVAVEVDTTVQFQTQQLFESKEEVLEWAKNCGRQHGVVVVVKRSDINDPKRNPRIMLGCERSGGYRVKRAPVKRRTSTKKCGCPFSLRAQIKDPVTGVWCLVVLNGKHNHALVRSFVGHSYVGRLSKDQLKTVENLSLTGVKTREILSQIKLNDPTNASTLRTIYNARSALRISATAGKSHMQQLFKLLTEAGYITRHRSEPTTEIVCDLFFANVDSIQLARSFPFVFMLDCTYKTNKYRLPLMQIVGVTSTDKTFSVAFCYMCAEKEDNYARSLKCFRDLFDGAVMPSVFITDREIALMNALKLVFPTAKSMLCRVHIQKNVLSNCIGFFEVKDEFDAFMKMWTTVMHSCTSEEYERMLKELQCKFIHKPDALSYVQDSWLLKYKECFVSAWIDGHLHLGNTTTNRVESSHAKLKRYLSSSVSGFVQSFQKINLLLEGQVLEIKASFEDSLTRVPVRFRNNLYKNLIGVVSTAALQRIESELENAGNVGVTTLYCTHKSVKSLGLPCAHLLTMYCNEGSSIPLSDVHNYWKKLNISTYSDEQIDDISIQVEMDMIYNTFALANIEQKREMKRQLQKFAKASSTDLLEPKTKVNLRGRPKKKKCFKTTQDVDHSTKRDPSAFEHALESHVFVDEIDSQASTAKVSMQIKKKVLPKLKVHRTRKPNIDNWKSLFPNFIQSNILNVIDVPGDGNCRYRVVASFFGWDINAWKKVRMDLADELKNFRIYYDYILAPLSSAFELLSTVECDTEIITGRDKWMVMPYMGIVISTCYKVVVILLSKDQCLTFLPLRDAVPLENMDRFMVFGYINDSHFVRLEISSDCPLPPVSKMWYDHHYRSADGNVELFTSRIEKFKELMKTHCSDMATVEFLD